MNAQDLVIIGASLAGAKAAEGARTEGWPGAIRLVGLENQLPYERPLLSKGVLIGRDEPSSALVHPGSFYATNEIDLLLGTAATRLDLANHRVELEGGRTLSFDRLVLATGSSPKSIPIPGARLTGVHTLRTLDDALRIRDALIPGSRIAVVGGSWIGTEVAACARQRGCEVVIADPMSTLLEHALGQEVGNYYADLHRMHGVELHLGMGVDSVEGDDRVKGVRFVDGTTTNADVVVVGIGVRPNIDLARDAGLDTAHGVLVDAFLRSSHPDVFAAGDIAEANHPTLGQRVRVEHWANARTQGLAAGRNAAGATNDYERIPYFFSIQYDSSMEYSGWPIAWDRVVFRGAPDDGSFAAFYLIGDRLVGGINVNADGVNEHVQRLVRDGGPVDIDQLVDVDVAPSEWKTLQRSQPGSASSPNGARDRWHEEDS